MPGLRANKLARLAIAFLREKSKRRERSEKESAKKGERSWREIDIGFSFLRVFKPCRRKPPETGARRKIIKSEKVIEPSE
jgi:hypothetical protein